MRHTEDAERYYAAAFQHVEMADKVGIRVCVRVFQGVADARLRGQMNHAIKFLARESSAIPSRSANSSLWKVKRSDVNSSRRASFRLTS